MISFWGKMIWNNFKQSKLKYKYHMENCMSTYLTDEPEHKSNDKIFAEDDLFQKTRYAIELRTQHSKK